MRMMAGRGERVQHRGQFGQRGGGKGHSALGQAGDVDAQRHAAIITGRRPGAGTR